MSQNESIKIHLEHLLKKSGLSKNKFCQKAEIQRSQLNGYINNTLPGWIRKCLCGYARHQTTSLQIYWNIFPQIINNKNSLKSLMLFQTIFIRYHKFSNLISKRNNTTQRFFQYILYPGQISYNKCLMHHQVILKKYHHQALNTLPSSLC